jgi:hypothetical protein
LDTQPGRAPWRSFHPSGSKYNCQYYACRGNQLRSLINDFSAIGAVRSLREAGLGVPEDVSVIGFDDVNSAAYQKSEPDNDSATVAEDGPSCPSNSFAAYEWQSHSQGDSRRTGACGPGIDGFSSTPARLDPCVHFPATKPFYRPF